MNLKDFDWLGFIGILVMLIGASLLSYYYIVNEINSCTRDPVKYTINEIIEDKNISWTYAEINLYANRDDQFPVASKIIDLNPIKNNQKLFP